MEKTNWNKIEPNNLETYPLGGQLVWIVTDTTPYVDIPVRVGDNMCNCFWRDEDNNFCSVSLIEVSKWAPCVRPSESIEEDVRYVTDYDARLEYINKADKRWSLWPQDKRDAFLKGAFKYMTRIK